MNAIRRPSIHRYAVPRSRHPTRILRLAQPEAAPLIGSSHISSRTRCYGDDGSVAHPLESLVLMRNPLILAAVAALPLVTGCALKEAYGGSGLSFLPYQGRALHKASELRLGFSPKQFPHWAGAFAFNYVLPPFDSASFVEPTCFTTTGAGAGCHPRIAGNSSALEVQHRWYPTQPVHPVASVALGLLTTEYFVRTGTYSARADSTQASPFVTVGGGGEFSLARWLHVTVTAGYRESFGKTIPNGTVSNSGFTLTTLLLVGKTYRD